jgi:three-Cys-motif partner protein
VPTPAHLVDLVEIDPCPSLLVERGPKNRGVGIWVPRRKHRLLCNYLIATRHARSKWPNRIFIDPFAGPGRIQVKGEPRTRDGGAALAWRAVAAAAPFTKVLVGDIEPQRAHACFARLNAIGAPAMKFVGPALHTVQEMIKEVPSHSLCTAYIDPYNLEYLSFSILKDLARLEHVDLVINFSTMDLQRNVDLESGPHRTRFDDAAPGWRDQSQIQQASRSNLKIEYFKYWCQLVGQLGFEYSEEMPWVRNDHGHSIYRMALFTRHALPRRIWKDIARGPTRNLELFE